MIVALDVIDVSRPCLNMNCCPGTAASLLLDVDELAAAAAAAAAAAFGVGTKAVAIRFML